MLMLNKAFFEEREVNIPKAPESTTKTVCDRIDASMYTPLIVGERALTDCK